MKRIKFAYLGVVILVSGLLSFGLKKFENQEGRASYYSNKFIGRKTTSGEIFDQQNFTAAHKFLPMGTFVKVTNLENDSVVVVKVNDRLHRSSGKIIDLTLKAARQLNFVRNGSARVVVEAVE